MTKCKFGMTCDNALRVFDHLRPGTSARITDHVGCLKQGRQCGIVGQRRIRAARKIDHVDDIGNARGNFQRQVGSFSTRSRLNSVDHNAARVAPSSIRTSTTVLRPSSRKIPVTSQPRLASCFPSRPALPPARPRSGCRQARRRFRWGFFAPANERPRNCSMPRMAAPRRERICVRGAAL